MNKQDVIVTAFACGGKMKCRKEAEKFKEPPIILNVPGGSIEGFVKTAQTFRAKNSVLDNFFASRRELKKIQPRRVCIVSFSDGDAWTTSVLRANKDIKRIDTAIVMDGVHTHNLKAWIDFAKLAAVGENAPKLWLAHTQLTKKTNAKIVEKVNNTNNQQIIIPDYIKNAQIENSISVYSKTERPKHKLYHIDPLCSFESFGNVARFEYDGNKEQDQIYNAQYTQPRFWQWLREIWADPTTGVFWSN